MVAPAIVAAGISAAADLAGGLIGSGSNNHRGRENREAIYNSVAQKVKAARDWGISPLYALGAPIYSPSAPVGGGDPVMGQAISNMGQDVSRAVAAGQTDAERALQALTLEKAGLENDYLRAQITSVRTRTLREVGPSLPGNLRGRDISLPLSSVLPGPKWKVEPGVSNSQDVADEYGDIAQELYGLYHLAVDAGMNVWDILKNKPAVIPPSAYTVDTRSKSYEAYRRRYSRF